MGLGRLVSRNGGTIPTEHNREITEFAIIDGVAVDGSGVMGAMYSGAMSIPGAWRAAVLISDMGGSAPWCAVTKDGDGYEEEIRPTPPLLEQPSPPESRVTTLSSLWLDLIWHGNAVGVYATRNAYGIPTSLYPVPARMVGVRRVSHSDYSPLPVGAIEYNIPGLPPLGSNDVLHVKGPCEPGALRGMGVLEYHLRGVLKLADVQLEQALSLAASGVPTGILKNENPDITPARLRKDKAIWMESQRTRTVAAFGPGMSFEPLAWDPEKLELVEARKYSLHEICLIFGLPLYFLGADQSSKTYSNPGMEGLNLLKFTLNGHFSRFEQALSLIYPRGTTVKADVNATILRADTTTRYANYSAAIGSNFMAPDEARKAEGWKPLPKPKVVATNAVQEPADPGDPEDGTDPGVPYSQRPGASPRPGTTGH